MARRGSRPLRVEGSGVTDDEPFKRYAVDNRISAGQVVGRDAPKLGEGRDAGLQERFSTPLDPGRESWARSSTRANISVMFCICAERLSHLGSLPRRHPTRAPFDSRFRQRWHGSPPRAGQARAQADAIIG